MNYQKTLKRKLNSLFQDESTRIIVTSILNEYGIEEYEQDPFRVRLAILKLSLNDLEEIKTNTKYAKQDFRDIISWAEYPRQSKNWSIEEGSKKERIELDDLAEYDEWLNT